MRGGWGWAGVLIALWLLVTHVSGCATTGVCVATDPTNLPCTCNGTQNPACVAPLTDAKKPPGGQK